MSKPAEHTPDELDRLRRQDRIEFLELVRDMMLAHHIEGRTIPQAVRCLDRIIAERRAQEGGA